MSELCEERWSRAERRTEKGRRFKWPACEKVVWGQLGARSELRAGLKTETVGATWRMDRHTFLDWIYCFYFYFVHWICSATISCCRVVLGCVLLIFNVNLNTFLFVLCCRSTSSSPLGPYSLAQSTSSGYTRQRSYVTALILSVTEPGTDELEIPGQ